MIKNDPDRQSTPPVTFTLHTDFQVKMHMTLIWLSSHFYSHKYGYKMQLKVFPNGTGKGAGSQGPRSPCPYTLSLVNLIMWTFCGIITAHAPDQSV